MYAIQICSAGKWGRFISVLAELWLLHIYADMTVKRTLTIKSLVYLSKSLIYFCRELLEITQMTIFLSYIKNLRDMTGPRVKTA